MRLVTFAVLAAGIATSGCQRTADPSAQDAAGTETNRPATQRAEWREITIPSGTHLPIILETSVASDTSRAEELVQAKLARAIVVRGVTALAEGSRVSGVVTDAKQAGRVKGRAHVALRFDSIAPRGGDERYLMRTAAVGRTAAATKKKDALEIGAPAAGGALIGGLVGGRKGALIGTGVGGGAGTAYVLSTRGDEVRLGKGAEITVQLTAPLTVKVRG